MKMQNMFLCCKAVNLLKRRERVMSLLEEIGLGGLENRFPRELSGGQQQRVAIARAVVSEPQLGTWLMK